MNNNINNINNAGGGTDTDTDTAFFLPFVHFNPQKPQHRDRHRDRKQSGAAASEEAEKGGESSSKQLARTKVHSRANKNRPQEVSFTQCAQLR